MNTFKSLFMVAVAAGIAMVQSAHANLLSFVSGHAVVSSFDNIEDPTYLSPNWAIGENAGFGFSPWQTLEGSPPIVITTTDNPLDGAYSLLAQEAAHKYAVSRPIAGGSLSNGYFEVTAQFLPAFSFVGGLHVSPVTSFVGFGLEDSAVATTNAGAFRQNSLLEFGLSAAGGSSEITIIAGNTTNYLALGYDDSLAKLYEGPIEFLVKWDTRYGKTTYTLEASNTVANTFATFSGQLAASAPVAAIGVANFATTVGQDLEFDDLTIAVPEPGVLLFWLTGLGTIWAAYRPWQKKNSL